eukprot:CAMPEP_0114687608 /NCGR_PEP_ID=MMETSP0191-20121206/62686_1 /TAXON_ID=126664 /ORGANISM="Sorites sp." /LENGTH=486 /DNA_ID=CAMNT_0001974337 /DNA_START=29 /DNA_END=1489 /DNA_ORIENTATION=+
MPKVSRGAIWTMYLIVLMDMLNFGIVFPLLPSIAEEFNANAMQVGSLATFFSVAQVLFTPILGWASDKYGRRPVLLIAIAGTTASTVLTGAAWNFAIMCVARAIKGASGGTVGIANAYIADVTNAVEKPTYISYLQACNSVGIIVGPALGGALAKWGFALPCYVSAVLSGLNFIVAMTHAGPEEGAAEGTTGSGIQENAARASGNARLTTRATSIDAGLDYIPWSAGLLFAAGFLFMLGFASFESVTGYYLLDTLYKGKGYVNPTEASGQFYGILFTVAGFAMLLTALLVYKPMLGCIGEFPTVAVGGVLRCGGFMFMSFAQTPVQFAAAAILQVIGGNLISPTTSSLLTTICSKRIYGKALGYQQSCQSIARIFAPTIFGYLYDHYDHRLTFWINAGTSVIAVPLILCVPRPNTTMDTQEVEQNIERLERQKSVPGVPPSLDGANHGTLRRQVSGVLPGTPTAQTQSLQRVEESQGAERDGEPSA